MFVQVTMQLPLVSNFLLMHAWGPWGYVWGHSVMTTYGPNISVARPSAPTN